MGIGLKASVGSRQLNSSVPCICSSWACESFFKIAVQLEDSWFSTVFLILFR